MSRFGFAGVALLALAGLQYAWNAAAQPGFWGYDEGAHAAFALAIRETGGLPHPLSGWSSFHPPLHAVLGAFAWLGLEPLGGRAVLFGLRCISAAGMLAVGAVLWREIAGRTGPAVAGATVALALFLPVSQLAASMAGNEALAAGLAALALPFLFALQRDPADARAALGAGLFAGLACATKFTGAWTLALCALPFLRRPALGTLRSAAVCLGVALVVAGPVYLRNVVVTGSPLPFTRNLQPMKHFEERLELRPRHVSDYGVSWRCGQYPYVSVVAEGGRVAGYNPAFQSVPCLLHGGLWFDPFGIRGARVDPHSGVVWGVALMTLGVVPLLVMGIGLWLALGRIVASRGRAEETPLVALLGLGLGSFTAFTWMAPSLAAAKASYLLPLVAPAGFLFAEGVAALPRGARITVLVWAGATAALAGFVFTTGTVFPAADAAASRDYWTRIGEVLPDSYIVEATRRIIE